MVIPGNDAIINGESLISKINSGTEIIDISSLGLETLAAVVEAKTKE